MPASPADPSGNHADASSDAAARRDQLMSLLGDLPDRDAAHPQPPDAELIKREQRDGYLLETLVLHLNGIEQVPAYFAKPLGTDGPLPTVVFNHSHGGGYTIGKKEFVNGREYLADPPYARALTEAGYAGLCIDHWLFGERRGRSESELFKEMLWNGQVLWGMMVFDTLRAVDYLHSRPDVDMNRLATLGISMGSTMAWWHAALDTRIKVCIDLCCLTDFQTFVEDRGLDRHGLYYYVPSLLKYFATSQINALIAPRPHLALAGNYDGLTPPAGLDVVDRELKQVYAEHDAEDAWRLLRYDIGHLETDAMRKHVMEWLERWL